MAKLGTDKRPAVVRVHTEERAGEILTLCRERGWQVIVGIEPDKPEDISDVERLLNPVTVVSTGPKVGRNDPCPCGSGKKYKRCCGREEGARAAVESKDQGGIHVLPSSAPMPAIPSTPATSSMPDRRAMERDLARMNKLMSEKEFTSEKEANAFLQSVLAGGGPPAQEPTTPLERAQEIMYDAWEARGGQRVKLARKALQISPDCADAYVLLAEEDTHTLEEGLDLCAKGVAAGERAIGEEAFKEDMGHFWGILETRPYMRARLGLAQCLWEAGRSPSSTTGTCFDSTRTITRASGTCS